MIILELIIILESSEVDSETERMLLESSDEEEQLPKGESHTFTRFPTILRGRVALIIVARNQHSTRGAWL